MTNIYEHMIWLILVYMFLAWRLINWLVGWLKRDEIWMLDLLAVRKPIETHLLCMHSVLRFRVSFVVFKRVPKW